MVPIPLGPDDSCLDFVNTRYWRGRTAPTETLGGMQEALDWCAGPGRAPPAAVAALARLWQAAPEGEMAARAAAHGSLIALREALFRLLAAAAGGQGAAAADLAVFNRALGEAAPRRRLAEAGDAYAWDLDPATASVAAVLSPVLWSAADLLAGRRRGHLRQCANPECRWMFLDDSKSGDRRWCTMSACGNRAKARRHYLKVKAEKEVLF